jgi:hypothetical protein
MTQSILLIAVLYAFVSVAATVSTAEFIAASRERRKGADVGHAFCALGAAFLGGALAARGATLESILEMALVLAALVSVVYAGFYLGGAPADIPAGALAVVAIAAGVHGTWGALAGAAGVGAPFLAGALYPPRRTDSFRDAAVAALGGALLGFGLGVGAAIVGAFLAFLSALSRRRGASALPAPHFAPYIATTLVAAIVVSALIALG